MSGTFNNTAKIINKFIEQERLQDGHRKNKIIPEILQKAVDWLSSCRTSW
jgi:hypothetical protein